MYPLEDCKKEITSEINKILSTYNISYEIKLETPPGHMGDFAFPCFQLAPQLKKSPQSIAQTIATQITGQKWITHVEAKAGYVNFFINNTELISQTLQSIHQKKTRMDI